MTLDACANLVARGDPDRFATVMAAPKAARARLLPLYAFNLEVARAPWASAEPMISEMRLQWWADTIEAAGTVPRPAHDIAGPLIDLVLDRRLPLATLAGIVEARRRDIYADRPNLAEFEAYIDDTAGSLMWLAALSLGADAEFEADIRAVGYAQGFVSMLQAVPELEARGRSPLPDTDLGTLIQAAQRRLESARRLPVHIRPAVWPAWQTESLLSIVRKQPERIAAGGVSLSEFQKRWLLIKTAYGM